MFSNFLKYFQNHQNSVSFGFSEILKNVKKCKNDNFSCFQILCSVLKTENLFREFVNSENLFIVKNNDFFVFSDIMKCFQNRQNGFSFTFSEILENFKKLKNDHFSCFQILSNVLKTAKTTFLLSFPRF